MCPPFKKNAASTVVLITMTRRPRDSPEKVFRPLSPIPTTSNFAMAGTLILLGRAGYEMHYMSIADGACGSQVTGPAQTAAIRLEEAKAAAHLIGAQPQLRRWSTTWKFSTTLPVLCASWRHRCARSALEILLGAFAGRLHGRPHERLPAGGHGGIYARDAQLRQRSAASDRRLQAVT